MEYHTMTLAEAAAIAEWEYPEDYALYKAPDFSRLSPQQLTHYLSFCLQGQLIGFVNLLEESDAIFFGIGVHPQACSQGLGTAITREAIAIAKQRWPKKSLYLEVRTWNQRAIRCYEKAGFTMTKTFQMTTHLGPGSFYRMELKQK